MIMPILDVPERTEIWQGADILNKSLQVLSEIKSSYDLCLDVNGRAVIFAVEVIKIAYFDLKKRGVRIRIITEITKSNISECKDMMINITKDVRHLDGIKGNFVIADKKGYAVSTISDMNADLPISELISSTARE